MECLVSCLDEISLDGLDGCPIVQLWKHLEERRPEFPLKLDDGAKHFLWNGIVGILDVEFFVLPEPLPHIFGKNTDETTENESSSQKPKNPLDEFQGAMRECNTFKLVSDQETGIKGSCPSYSVRKNVSKEIRGEQTGKSMSLETAYERWGDCLVLVASQELRNKAILGLNFDPHVYLSDVQYCLLEYVGQARYKGRMQRSMSTSYMNIESKSTFHHLKGLKAVGLISIQAVVITTCNRNQQLRNYQTNIVRLRRFHVQQFHKYDVIASQISKLLLAAPGHHLPLTDVMNSFAHIKPATLRKIRLFLQQGGYLKVEPLLTVKEEQEVDQDEDCSRSKKKKKKSVVLSKGLNVQLLKPFVLKADSFKYDEDDDEEDDEDDEENPYVDGYHSKLVAERPIMRQMYDVIEKGGTKGFTLAKFTRATKLPFPDVRHIVKFLIKGRKVNEVHQDIGKQRVMWFVAAPHAESNREAIMVKQERHKLQQMESKAAGTPGMSPVASPCPSPAPSNPSEDTGEKKPRKTKSMLGEKVTYRSLKRKTVILEYLQKVKVIEGSAPLLKAIIASEEEEGQDGRIDRKVLRRILDELITQRMVRHMKTVVQHGTFSQMVELYLDSSIANDDPAVSVVLDQCRFRLADQSAKMAETRDRGKQREEAKEKRKVERAEKKRLEKERQKEQKKEKQQKKEALSTSCGGQVAGKKSEQKHALTNKHGFLPKFPRLQLLHELIWKLVHDRDTSDHTFKPPDVVEDITLEPSPLTEPAVNDNGQECEGSESIKQPIVKFDDFQGNDDEWMNHLERLQRCYSSDNQPTPGWFRITDLLSVMPFSVLCQTTIVFDEIVGLDDYVLDPVKKFTPVRGLPYALKVALTEKARFKAAVKEWMCLLCQLGLLTPSLPIPSNQNNARIFLNKGVKLLDTTTSTPSYQTTSPPSGTSFESRTHLFTSMAAVRNYWNDLKCVSLNTPLGVVREEGTDADKVPLSVTNKNRRLVQYAWENVEEDRVELPPGDLQGAAGLDRSLFSHLKRNWTRVMEKPPKKTPVVKENSILPTSNTIKRAELEKGADGITDSSECSAQEESKTFISLGVPKSKKLAKKSSKELKKLKRKPEAEPSTEEREPKKRRTEEAEKQKSPSSSSTEKQKHYISRGHLNAIDEEDRNILARKGVERVSFSAEEDNWLTLFRIALGVMKSEATRFYPCVCMRNILHKAVSSSLDKTAPNLQRRIWKLMKSPQSQMTVRICLAECAHDQTFQGYDDPNLPFDETFLEVVKKLRQKFSSSSLSIVRGFTLVSSLEEFYDKFKVQTVGSKERYLSDQQISSLGPEVKTVSDVNKTAIRDQIQIAFTTPQHRYDAYRVFQMFNNYTKEELEEVFKDMQKKNLVARRKYSDSPSGQYTRSLPFVSMTYQLSFGYHRLFLRGFQLVTFYRDCANFLSQLVRGDRHTLCDPRTSSSREEPQERQAKRVPGTMEVRPQSTLGGHVACILSLLATRQVSLEVTIPDEILNMDPSELVEKDPAVTDTETDSEPGPSQPPAKTFGTENVAQASESAAGSVPSSTSSTSGTTSPLTTTKAPEKSNKARASPKKKREAPDEDDTDGPVSQPTKKKRQEKSRVSAPPDKATCKAQEKEKATSPSSAKKLEKREVFALSFPSSTVTKFTSPYNLKSLKESCNFFDSQTEMCEGTGKATHKAGRAKIPVASLSYGGTSSRSSRTALMLARGGKDPYVSMQQLPARALNTHDFMSLHPCKNVLTMRGGGSKDGSGGYESITDVISQTRDTSTDLSDNALSVDGEGQQRSSIDGPNALDVSSVKGTQEFLDSSKSHLEGEPAETQCVGSFTSPVVVRSDVSIDDHIERSKERFSFNEGDVSLSRIIYGFVSEAEELGVTVTVLRKRINERAGLELHLAQYSFEEHLKYMCDYRLLYRVGVYEPSLVTASFVKPWSVMLLKPKKGGHQKLSEETIAEKRRASTSSDTSNSGTQTLEKKTEPIETNTDLGEVQASTCDDGETGTKTNETCLDTSQAGIPSNQSASKDVENSETGDDSQNVASICEQTTADNQTDSPGEARSSEEIRHSSKKAEGHGRKKESYKGKNYEQYSVISRPWITIDGTTSLELLRMFREIVLMLILDKPGISEVDIAKHFYEALRPVALKDILESLIVEGCIVKHLRSLPPRMSLFSKPKSSTQCETITFYTPTVDCIVKLATSKISGYS